MQPLQLGPGAADFVWATGIEDTFVPQTRAGHRPLDEYQLLGHYEHWREDLALARDLGVRAIRWGVPWYRVEPIPGEFDWHWVDQVIPYMVEELGITPIIDLMHYGCPFWLRREFDSDDYPAAVASYAAAFAARYGQYVRWYTPLNEPLINAMMCGRRGLWPPYLRGDNGYVRMLLQLVRGISRTVAAVKAVQPDSIMVHVDAAGRIRAGRSDLEGLAAEEQVRGYIGFDLLTGRVTPEHPVFSWLVRHGASPDALAALAHEPVAIDVLGLNFYPQWSTQQLSVDGRGRLTHRAVDQQGAGFAAMVAEYYDRYNVPIFVTETSARGTNGVRSQWLEAAVGAVKYLRANGIPILGYTWFPLFTMIDWRYRFGRAPVDAYRLELGLYHLGPASGPRWLPSPLVPQLKSYISNSEESVGQLVPTQAPVPSP